VQFDDFQSAHRVWLGAIFVIAFALGVVANKTRFCTMGGLSDWISMGDRGRWRSWLLAIAVAMFGMAVLETAGWILADRSFPPYRAATLIWAENILGGFLFGVGMTLASGCSNRIMVRAGAGNLKSIVVLLVMAPFAYFMVMPLPGSDETLYSLLFHDWLRPLAIDLPARQDLGSLIASDHAAGVRLTLGVLLAAALFWYCLRSAEFRRSRDNILGGIVVGGAILGAWLVTSNIVIDTELSERLNLQDYARQWDFLADSAQERPADTRTLAPQSFSFVNPVGESFEYALHGFAPAYLSFGVMAVGGVILGSLFWALISRGFRIEWFASAKDFLRHCAGGILMAVGGILALGCTFGQGITGVSTLALGSFLALGAIILGCTLTIKIEYYRLMYEEQATFFTALTASLADLKIWPARLRRLDPV
jgi:uncharacterized membrane protein YedE/YeeE